MTKIVTAVFDGRALHPDTPLDLEPNTRYVITVQDTASAIITGNAWDTLEALAGTIEAESDWAGEHDHYLYGTPERQREADV